VFVDCYPSSAMRALEPQTGSPVRLTLGLLQMAGVGISVVLLYRGGVTTLALAAATFTTALTALSIALFGERR
jgi:hypothetical protein